MRRVVAISDLHLGADRGDIAPKIDAALDHFVDGLVTVIGPEALILVGDSFDLLATAVGGGPVRAATPDVSDSSAIAKLDRIAAENPVAFDALRRLLRSGIALDVIVGNHDIELARPAVTAHLRTLLASDGGEVHVHPWLLHIPGILYAEHGHQHHDVNAIDRILGAASGARVEVPLASHMPARGHSSWQRAQALLALAKRGVASTAPVRHIRRRGYATTIEAAAGGLDLSPATAIELDELRATGSILSTALRVTRRALTRSLSDATYLQTAMARVDATLAASGNRVGCLIAGHSHQVGCWRLPSGGLYCNTGTWSPFIRGSTRELTLTYVEVDLDTGEGSVHRWDDARRLSAPLV